MLSGGRPVDMSGFFMGEQPPTPATGLDSLTIVAIQNRAAATPLVERFLAEKAQLATRGFRSGPLPPPWDRLPASRTPVPEFSPGEKATILALAADPSSEVLDDLSLIDGFFGVLPSAEQYQQAEEAFTPELCSIMNGRSGGGWMGRGNPTYSAAQMVAAWMNYVPTGRGAVRHVSTDEIEAIRSNPFYCGTAQSFPEVVYGSDKRNYAAWFNIDPNQTWGQVKVQVHNAVTVMGVVAGYPFPPPIDMEKAAPFWILSIGDIQEIVRSPLPVDPEVVRVWITLQVLANYSAWVDRIAKDQKKKAKKAKRKAIMTAVGLALASIVAAFILPAMIALIVSAIKTAVTVYIDAQKRKKAAEEMAKASKMFAADAPAFSKEIDHANSLIDEQAAKQAAAAPPSPEVQAAITEVQAETGPDLKTILPVGGGIAAAGLAAFLIFK